MLECILFSVVLIGFLVFLFFDFKARNKLIKKHIEESQIRIDFYKKNMNMSLYLDGLYNYILSDVIQKKGETKNGCNVDLQTM